MALQSPSEAPSDFMAKSQNIEHITSFSQMGEKHRDLRGSDHNSAKKPWSRSSSHLKATLTIALVGVVVLFNSGLRFRMEGSGPQAKDLANNDTSQVLPSHYDLFIQTNLTARTFAGYASIQMDVKSSSAETVTLHAHSTLLLHSLSISKGAETISIPPSAISRDEARDRVHIPVPKVFELGKGDQIDLRIAWQSNLSSLATGYYFDTYLKEHGEEDTYSVTQFEPTSARAALPCWDEVSPKATFSVTMLSEADTINLANMDVLDEGILGNISMSAFDLDATRAIGSSVATQKLTRFRKTPLMSIYLLAFANGHFKNKAGSYKSPLTGEIVPLRVYATSDVIEHVDCALEVTTESISTLEKLFDIPYPLPKLDSLVSAKSKGAMENWGLITGGPQSLACPPSSGLAAYTAMFLMQTHELAHQWFGNIVTMESWGQLWLNEAFATFTGEFVVPGIVHPEWKTDESFLTSHVFVALNLDAQRYSHPIEIEIADSDDVGNFDAISYSKGASILRMLSIYIGQEPFLKGVSQYLKQHSYGNANTKHLWAAITESSGQDVAAIAQSWTEKIGFPVLTTDVHGGILTIRQDRFLSTGDMTDEENDTIWCIPLNLLTVLPDGTRTIYRETILSSKETVVDLKGAALYQLNSGFAGFFRVAYSSSHLELLGLEGCRNNSALSPADRAGLISDVHALSAAGYMPTHDLLSLVQTLAKCETSLVGWTSIAEALGSVRSVWWEQPKYVQRAVETLTMKAFGPLIDKLGFEFPELESPEISKLRVLAYAAAGSAGYLPVVRHAQQAFTEYFEGNHSSTHPDLRRAVFGIAVSHGGEEEHSVVADLYKQLAPSALKDEVIFALTQTKKPDLIQATLVLTSDAEPRDILNFVHDFGDNVHGRRPLLNWMFDNIDTLLDRFKKSLLLALMIKPPLSVFTSEKDLQKIEAFFSGRDQSGYEQYLEQALESVQARANWVERDGNVVKEWLKENGYF